MKQATFFICAFLVLFQLYSGAYASDESNSNESTASAADGTEIGTTADSTDTDSNESASAANSNESTASAADGTETGTTADSASSDENDTNNENIADIISALLEAVKELEEKIREHGTAAVEGHLEEKVEWFEEKIEWLENIAEKYPDTWWGAWASEKAESLREILEILFPSSTE